MPAQGQVHDEHREYRAIVEALDELTTASHRHWLELCEKSLAGRQRDGQEVVDELRQIIRQTKAEARSSRLLGDAVGGAFRLAIAALGERLYELDGLKAMGDALGEVADRHPDIEDWIEGHVDARWNGIGSDERNWWAS